MHRLYIEPGPFNLNLLLTWRLESAGCLATGKALERFDTDGSRIEMAAPVATPGSMDPVLLMWGSKNRSPCRSEASSCCAWNRPQGLARICIHTSAWGSQYQSSGQRGPYIRALLRK